MGWVIGLSLAPVLLGLSGCDRATKATTASPAAKDTASARAAEKVLVSLAPSKVQSVQRSVEVVGTLYGDQEVTISAKVAGRITAIFQDVGDRTGPNQPLAQIDKVDYELAREQRLTAMNATLAKLGLDKLPGGSFDPELVPTVVKARRTAENALAKLKRAEQLYQQTPPLMSEQDYLDLKTAYEVAKSSQDVELLTARSTLADALSRKSDLDLAVQRLEDTVVRAPAASTQVAAATQFTAGNQGASTQPAAALPYAVASRLVSVGEYVLEGTALFKMVADNPIKYRAQVPERFVSEVKVGQAVTVKVEAYTQSFSGKVWRLSPQIDPASRTFQVEVRVENQEGLLRPGAFARGAILTHRDEQVTFVPREAVVSFAGIKKVFTVKDGKAVESQVQTAQGEDESSDYVEVVEGFSGVQPVVVNGQSKLSQDMPVEVKAPTTGEAGPAAAKVKPAAAEAKRAAQSEREVAK